MKILMVVLIIGLLISGCSSATQQEQSQLPVAVEPLEVEEEVVQANDTQDLDENLTHDGEMHREEGLTPEDVIFQDGLDESFEELSLFE
jgi:hypothetical protein